MIAEAAVLAFIIGYIKGGNIKNVSAVRFRFWYLLILGFFVQRLPSLMGAAAEDYLLPVMALSYFLILFALSMNLKQNGVFYAFSGTLFNALAIVSNRGMMPVTIGAVNASGYEGVYTAGQQLDMMHFVSDSSTRFELFADFISVPPPYPIPQVISGGDILLCVGVYIFIYASLLRKPQDPQAVS